MRSHFSCVKAVMLSAAMLLTSAAVPYAVMNDPSSAIITASAASSTYTITPNQTVDYSKLPEDDRMIGWEWSEFGIPANEKVTKVEINISASKAIGKWQGAFGTSTTVSPDYWTQTDEMEQKISGTSGTITWNVDSATSKIIQYGYGGELKWGIWWIDCGTFTIDSIKVYTDGSSSATTTTKTPEVTTAPAVTTMVTTTSKAAVSSSDVTSGGDVKPTLIGDITGDGDIDVRDVTLLNQYIVKLTDLDAQQIANADIIKDGKIDLKDLGQLKKYLIKVIDSLE